jgi:hypothetical protein
MEVRATDATGDDLGYDLPGLWEEFCYVINEQLPTPHDCCLHLFPQRNPVSGESKTRFEVTLCGVALVE